ncbi:hypothetical protein PG993_004400 [Apiospora rasikravindrae]|uniref:Uncharacterized protein n=1 Tax=Apiospora rasikravindrae TaxID=990691 RepID=A0ABR1TEF1_9PEZI
MAPTTRGENGAENDAFAGPNSTSGGEKPAASLTPWVIIAITAASFLAVTFIGFVGVTLMRRRQRCQRQRLGANAAATAVKQHRGKYYCRQTHNREASFERPWPSLNKSHYQQPEEAAAELQRAQLIGKARASRESWSSYGGSVMVAEQQSQQQQQQQQQSSFSRPHDYTAVSAHDHHHHQDPTPSTSTTRGAGGAAAASRGHGQYRYDDSDSEQDEEQGPAPDKKKSMSSRDWKELEAQTGRMRSSSLQDPATLGRGHPAFSPELRRAPLPAKLPRTLVVTDVVGRRAAT